jgi:hypothetical protein
MRESKIERHLRVRIHRIGGLCIKMGQDGWPDRLVILPGGETVFVELKATDGRVKPHQARRHETLDKYEQEVIIPRSVEDINKRFPIRG